MNELVSNTPHLHTTLIRFPMKHDGWRKDDKPIFEVDQTTLNSLKELLKSNFREEFHNLENTYNVLSVKNKEGVSPPGPPVDFSNLGDDL